MLRFCICFLACTFCYVADAGVIACFQFEGNLINSVNSVSAVARGNPQYVQGIHGTALQVSTGNYAAIMATNAFVPQLSSFSAAIRFKLTGTNTVTKWASLLSMQGGDFSEGAVLSIHPNDQLGDEIAIGLHDGSAFLRTSYRHNQSLMNQWHHASYVVNRSTSRVSLFLDGTKVAEQAFALGSIDPTFDYLLGQYDYVFGRNGHPRFVGGQDLIIDDVYLYDHALSDSEVASLASLSSASVPEPTSLGCVVPFVLWLVKRSRRKCVADGTKSETP